MLDREELRLEVWLLREELRLEDWLLREELRLEDWLLTEEEREDERAETKSKAAQSGWKALMLVSSGYAAWNAVMESIACGTSKFVSTV